MHKKSLRRKEKLGINQENRSLTSGRGSLLNLTKVRITIKGNGYGKGRYYNKCYDDDLDLITTDESSCSELEDESHNDSVSQEKKHFGIFRKFINTY